MRAAVYARVSTLDQNVHNQLEELRRYLPRGWTADREFVDRGWTVGVTTSNYDAEFGRSGGAVTNVTLKSGTNDLKGSLFFFGNTDATNASDYFTHLKARRSPPTAASRSAARS